MHTDQEDIYFSQRECQALSLDTAGPYPIAYMPEFHQTAEAAMERFEALRDVERMKIAQLLLAQLSVLSIDDAMELEPMPSARCESRLRVPQLGIFSLAEGARPHVSIESTYCRQPQSHSD